MPPGGAQEMLKAIHLSPVLHQLLRTDVSCPPDTESGGSHSGLLPSSAPQSQYGHLGKAVSIAAILCSLSRVSNPGSTIVASARIFSSLPS